MTIAEVNALWEQDCPISPSNLDGEAGRVPALHSKYWKIYSHERRVYTQLKGEFAKLRLRKLKYYTGKMDDGERVALGWPVHNLLILVKDVGPHLDGDPDIVRETARLEDQDTKLKLLEDIIKQIGWRNNLLKTMVDYQRFAKGEL
jgi:hypothetical protein